MQKEMTSFGCNLTVVLPKYGCILWSRFHVTYSEMSCIHQKNLVYSHASNRSEISFSIMKSCLFSTYYKFVIRDLRCKLHMWADTLCILHCLLTFMIYSRIIKYTSILMTLPWTLTKWLSDCPSHDGHLQWS